MIYLIVASIVLLVMLYKRYFPVLGVKYFPFEELDLSKLKILDVRDYNESYKNAIAGLLNIPLGYLKRNINEILHGDLHLVVSSLLEKNVGARVLRQKGFRVVGYSLANNKYKESHFQIKVNC